MGINSPAKRHPARSVSGWALDALVRLDETCPGTLRFFALASPLRRQGMCLVLAHMDWDRPEHLAALLTAARPSEAIVSSDPLAQIAQEHSNLSAPFGSTDGVP